MCQMYTTIVWVITKMVYVALDGEQPAKVLASCLANFRRTYTSNNRAMDGCRAREIARYVFKAMVVALRAKMYLD